MPCKSKARFFFDSWSTDLVHIFKWGKCACSAFLNAHHLDYKQSLVLVTIVELCACNETFLCHYKYQLTAISQADWSGPKGILLWVCVCVCVWACVLACVCVCVRLITRSPSSIIQAFKKKNREKERKREALSALCSVTCLCPLVRIVWNRFYWKSLFIILHWRENIDLFYIIVTRLQKVPKKGSKQADKMSVTIHFFYQLGCWFNILKKALNTSLFIASVRTLPVGCLSHSLLPSSLEALCTNIPPQWPWNCSDSLSPYFPSPHTLLQNWTHRRPIVTTV